MSNIGLIGLAVMGSNLARNIESRGEKVVVYNRSSDVTDKFMAEFKDKNFDAAKTYQEFVTKIQRPRNIIIMVQAGAGTDAVIDALLEVVEQGDTIIDGGNAYFKDTQRREEKCRAKGIYFLGVGISGGEEGALKGPSIMPGGDRSAWERMESLFARISAKAEDGTPCTDYIGRDGAGHFVKMVHNGIEYGDMQLIAEGYHLLRNLGGYTPPELAEIFTTWNKGVLESFLIEITSKIFEKADDKTANGYLVDKILDKAGQKGTGKWTVEQALDIGVSIPTLAAAVDARVLSSQKDFRVKADSALTNKSTSVPQIDRKELVKLVHDALYASKIMAYAQGMDLLNQAGQKYEWNLNLGSIASLWRGGCIIRARFLNQIKKAYDNNSSLQNLILDPYMKEEVLKTIPSLRKIVTLSSQAGIPIPAYSASLSYFDSISTSSLPQNLTQAQRDFFGAHTYQRTDMEGVFHSEWPSLINN